MNVERKKGSKEEIHLAIEIERQTQSEKECEKRPFEMVRETDCER